MIRNRISYPVVSSRRFCGVQRVTLYSSPHIAQRRFARPAARPEAARPHCVNPRPETARRASNSRQRSAPRAEGRGDHDVGPASTFPARHSAFMDTRHSACMTATGGRRTPVQGVSGQRRRPPQLCTHQHSHSTAHHTEPQSFSPLPKRSCPDVLPTTSPHRWPTRAAGRHQPPWHRRHRVC